MRNQYRLHFFYKEGSIYCRIHSFGKPVEFSTRLKLSPEQWNADSGKVVEKGKHKHPQAAAYNSRIEEIKSDLKRIQEDLHYRYKNHGFAYTATDIKLTFEGRTNTENAYTLLSMFEQHNRKMEESVGQEGGYEPATIKNYWIHYNNVSLFIRDFYGKPDLLLTEVKKQFANDMKSYMLKDRLKGNKVVKFSLEYIRRHLESVNRVMNFALNNEVIQRNPLQGTLIPRTNYMDREIVYLEEEELARLESYVFPNDTLQRVADCTIFACYTGLAYYEQRNLKPEQIVKGIDGKEWLQIVRKKTKKHKPLPVKFPLEDKAKAILEKYKDDAYCRLKGMLLPVFANSIYNRLLKEIDVLLGINKGLTTHHGRKSYCCILLNNDVPIETISAIVGDSPAVIRKHYARITERKIDKDMQEYRERKLR